MTNNEELRHILKFRSLSYEAAGVIMECRQPKNDVYRYVSGRVNLPIWRLRLLRAHFNNDS